MFSPSMENKPISLDTLLLPPGFRFHPTDEELIVHYLRNQVTSTPLPVSIIAEINLYKYNPWDLPEKALFGDEEWYFFTPRDRKYPMGARPNRAAASGYWKATGTDKPILNSCGTRSIGVKKALVFYEGRPPKGYKTDWIMHEYRLLDTIPWTPKRNGSMRLDDWVLCRVRKKSCSNARNTWEDTINPGSDQASGFLPKVSQPLPENTNPNIEMMKSYLYNDCPMLPSIFASQDFPCVDKPSSISFQDSENLQQVSVSSLDSFFNPLRRKVKKIADQGDVDKEEQVMISVNNDSTDKNVNEADNLSGDNNFTHIDQWNCINLQYQELNSLHSLHRK